MRDIKLNLFLFIYHRLREISDKEKSSSFDKVFQYINLLQSIAFFGNDAHIKESAISKYQLMMDIIMQSSLSVIKDGIYYGAKLAGKTISKESKKLLEDKFFFKKFKRKSLIWQLQIVQVSVIINFAKIASYLTKFIFIDLL